MLEPVTACGSDWFACSRMLSSYNQHGSEYPALFRAAVCKMNETDVCYNAGALAVLQLSIHAALQTFGTRAK